jgi:hypothetical protein
MQLLYIEDLIHVSWDPSGDYFGSTDDGFKMCFNCIGQSI